MYSLLMPDFKVALMGMLKITFKDVDRAIYLEQLELDKTWFSIRLLSFTV
mgnify:CR=1 FL=1